MKVLIIGGTGFIGSHTVEALVSRGHDLTILSRHSIVPSASQLGPNDYRSIAGDFRDSNVILSALKGIDCAIHLAWSGVPHKTITNPSFEFENNVIGSLPLIEACAKSQNVHLIFASSGGTVYGSSESLPICESHVTRPISAYGISKVAVEHLVYMYHNSHDLKYTVLRISNAYGERQVGTTGQGVIGTWLTRIKGGEAIQMVDDGSIVRDYIYVKDIAQAICLAAESHDSNRTYNVGTGIGTSLNQLVRLVRKIVPMAPLIVPSSPRSFDIKSNILDFKKIKEELNWAPTTSLHKGICETWKQILTR
jgi:UDP-glucose 4-epimerase